MKIKKNEVEKDYFDDPTRYMITLDTELVKALISNDYEFYTIDVHGDDLLFIFRVKLGIHQFADGYTYRGINKQHEK